MKTSISTVSISGDLRDKLSVIAKAGFDGVEIFEQDFIMFSGSPREVGQLIADHGLRIDLFQPVRDFEGLAGAQRQRAFDRIERKFDLMGELGADLVLISATTHPDALGGVDRSANDFRELGDRAAKRGIKAGFEAVAWGRHVKDHRDAWEVVRRADHPNIGLILDSFHTLAQRLDPDTIRAIPGDRIFHVQLSDVPMIEMDLSYLSRHFRCMPGEGDLPLSDFVQAVAATGYDGAYSLEIMNDQFRSGSPRIIAQDGYRSLLFLMDQVHRIQPGTSADRPLMPPRSHIEGVSFIEFTANEAEAKTLGKMLGTLGFVPVARHKSKRVTQWQQGEINIVINTEQEGFAHSAYVMHGMSVCDIGLIVDDAQQAVQRAEALGANAFSQKRGQDELNIPAVRGLGGSVLHFLDRKSELRDVWAREFKALEIPEESRQAGLTHVDHIAQTMNNDEMLTWTLFYLSIFDLEKTPMVDVADPGGLVHSRAIQNPDGNLRLTLNGVDTYRTFAGRFVADSFGSPVQHLAFATGDLVQSAEKLLQNGFEPLPIPENYYADLPTRFDLAPETIGTLKRLNILYDEDANGSYLQLYSRPYGGGFFFEIVERRGGYSGYGASNAPYRTAAQKRFVRPEGMPRR